MNTVRAAALLRVQEIRERIRRQDLARSRRERDAAAEAARSATAAVEASREDGIERLRRAYAALEGRPVTPTTLDALPVLAHALALENTARERASAKAADAANAADADARAALVGVALASQATRRRARLAERSRARWRRAVDAVEEHELDEAAAQAWSPP